MCSSGPGRDSRDPRVRLAELRAETHRRVASLTSTFEGIVEATRAGATDDEHDPEGHTIAWERQQVGALLAEAGAKLAEIDAAVRRLDAASYGVCTGCGRDIAVDRLDALPATPTCVRCASATHV